METFDNIIGVNYRIEIMNLIDLRNKLVDTYAKFNFKFDEYKGVVKEDKYNLSRNINVLERDTYEYNTINLLECDNYYILLDGHRRLFLNFDVVPNFDVPVRIYRRTDISDNKLVELMIYLNQHKIIGNGSGFFLDNGFTILFKILFNVDFSDKFEFIKGFLYESSSNFKDVYSRSESLTIKHIPELIERMSSKYFIHAINTIDNMNIPELKKSRKFGALFREFLNENDTEIDLSKMDLELYLSQNKLVRIDSTHASDVKNHQIYVDNMRVLLNESIGKSIYTSSMQFEDVKKIIKDFDKKYIRIKELRAFGHLEKNYNKIVNIIDGGKCFELHYILQPTKGSPNVLPVIHFVKKIEKAYFYTHLMAKLGMISDYIKSNEVNIDNKVYILDENNQLMEKQADGSFKRLTCSFNMYYFIGEIDNTKELIKK